MMDQVAERKRNVLKRLSKEAESLSALRDLTNRSSTVAGGMVSILDSFEHRLAKLETTILPVYQQTGNLQRRHQNIEKTLSALDHVLSFYNAARESESIIRGGRPGEANGGVPGYIEAMNKLGAAAAYFRNHNPHSVELSNVNTLFDAGREALGREFREELMKYKHSLNPIVVLDLVALEGEELSDEALSSIELIPAGVTADLAVIAAWLDEHDHTDKLVVYAKIRSQSLTQSLQALKDHQRTCSAERGGIRGLGSAVTPGGAVLSPSGPGMANSPAPTLRSRFGNKLDVTPKSRSHKLSNMLERRANWMIQRAKGRPGLASVGGSPASPFSPYVPTSPFSPGGGASTANLAPTTEEVLDVSEVLLYHTQVTAVSRLGLVEQRLLEQIVPVARQSNTLEILLRTPLEQLSAQGEHISNVSLKSMQKGDSSSMLCLLMLLRHLSQTQPEYERLLQSCSQTLINKYCSIIRQMQNTVVECLDVVMEGVRGDSTDKALPRDGTVHQQTSNILVFLQQLQEYTGALGPILLKDSTLRSSASVAVLQGDSLTFEQSQALLASYFKRVLSNLGASIMQRSEAYSDATLRAVFRLNNYNYLITTLLTTNIMATLQQVEPEAKKHYQQQIMQQKQIYQQSWNALLNHLSFEEDLQLQAGKMRDRDKQILKDKFSGFNKEIEDMQRTQRSYSIPDRTLRDSIKRDNKEFILPKYQAFYDRYSSVPFSRNPEKYVKYNPAEVAALMDRFFDVAA